MFCEISFVSASLSCCFFFKSDVKLNFSIKRLTMCLYFLCHSWQRVFTVADTWPLWHLQESVPFCTPSKDSSQWKTLLRIIRGEKKNHSYHRNAVWMLKWLHFYNLCPTHEHHLQKLVSHCEASAEIGDTPKGSVLSKKSAFTLKRHDRSHLKGKNILWEKTFLFLVRF